MKYFILFLLIQYSFISFAHQGEHEEECLPAGLPSEQALLKAITAPLALWTSTEVQMQKAPCRSLKAPTMEEMDYVIRSNSRGDTQKRTINGVTLEDDPRMLTMFMHLTTNFGDFQNPKNFQELFKINPECSNVSCAMAKIWGPKYGMQMSYLYLHFGFNSSEYSFPNATRFNEGEMNDILIALKDFPDAMTPLTNGNRQLTRYTRGKWDPEFRPGTFATSDVQVYDPWTKTSAWERQQTIFHEVTHMLTEKGTDYSPEWLNLSGWKGSGDSWTASKKNCMVGRYGSKTPGEDFAESAVAYRYNPSRLYKGCPEKYQYMKKFFKGAEYFAASSCEDK